MSVKTEMMQLEAKEVVNDRGIAQNNFRHLSTSTCPCNVYFTWPGSELGHGNMG